MEYSRDELRSEVETKCGPVEDWLWDDMVHQAESYDEAVKSEIMELLGAEHQPSSAKLRLQRGLR